MSVFKRSKLTVRIGHYKCYLNAIYTLIFRLDIDWTNRAQQPERNSADYNTISYTDIVKRRPQYNHPQRWRQKTNSVMEEAYHRVNRNLGRGHGIQMVRRYPTKRGGKHFHENHIPTDIPEWHPDCTNIILFWTTTGCWIQIPMLNNFFCRI